LQKSTAFEQGSLAFADHCNCDPRRIETFIKINVSLLHRRYNLGDTMKPSSSYLSETIETHYILPVETTAQSSNPLDRFLQFRQSTLNRSIKDTVGLIYQREDLKQRNLYQLLMTECDIDTKLANTEVWDFGVNPVIDKRRAILEKELLDIDKERRKEEVAAWKDTLTLKGDLRELLNQLYKEQSRKELLYQGR
jgi:hypothetical protein